MNTIHDGMQLVDLLNMHDVNESTFTNVQSNHDAIHINRYIHTVYLAHTAEISIRWRPLGPMTERQCILTPENDYTKRVMGIPTEFKFKTANNWVSEFNFNDPFCDHTHPAVENAGIPPEVMHVKLTMPGFVEDAWDKGNSRLTSFEVPQKEGMHVYKPFHLNFKRVVEGEFVTVPVELEVITQDGETDLFYEDMDMGLVLRPVMRKGPRPANLKECHTLT